MKIKLGLSTGVNVGRLGIPRSGVSPASTYSISGIVYDADGSTAVASATVALGALTATSAANGTYTISAIPAGTSGSMTCTKTGYAWTAKTISAMSGNLTTQNYVNRWYAAKGIAASCVAAYQAIGAASYAASKVNLANPGTYDLTLHAGNTDPTFDTATGWTYATTGRVLDTGISNPATTWSALVQFASAPASNNLLFGFYPGATTSFGIFPSLGGAVYYESAIEEARAPGLATGNLGIAGNKVYRNGSQDGGALGTQGTVATRVIGIAGDGADGSRSMGGGCVIEAVVFYNATLDGTQMAAVAAAMAALP